MGGSAWSMVAALRWVKMSSKTSSGSRVAAVSDGVGGIAAGLLSVDGWKGSGERRRCRLDAPVLESVWGRLVRVDTVDTSDPVDAEAALKQGLDLGPQKRLEEALDCVSGEGACSPSRYEWRSCMVPEGGGVGDRCRLRVGGGGEFGREGAIVEIDQVRHGDGGGDEEVGDEQGDVQKSRRRYMGGDEVCLYREHGK